MELKRIKHDLHYPAIVRVDRYPANDNGVFLTSFHTHITGIYVDTSLDLVMQECDRLNAHEEENSVKTLGSSYYYVEPQVRVFTLEAENE